MTLHVMRAAARAAITHTNTDALAQIDLVSMPAVPVRVAPAAAPVTGSVPVLPGLHADHVPADCWMRL